MARRRLRGSEGVVNNIGAGREIRPGLAAAGGGP